MEVENAATLAISGFSLWIAIKAYAQSVPRLQLEMWVANVFNSVSGERSNQRFLFVQVVNTSIRPVTIKNLGGHNNSKLSRMLKLRFPVLFGKPTSFIWQNIDPLITNSTGKFKILQDGESTSHQIPLTTNITSIGDYQNKIGDMKSIWVSDAAGREYYLDKRALKKLKTDLMEFNRSL